MTSDVVVIGGGIVGCTIAWRLAGEGVPVTLIERAQPGAKVPCVGRGAYEGL